MTQTQNSRLQAAVHQHRLTSFRGLSERMFTAWFGGFFYNQIWEDPIVDLEALEIAPDSRMLTISSGGCNVLTYLTARPASITAIDINACHIYLTRLKLAAMKYLPTYEDFFRFFGCANLMENKDNYYKYLKDHLDEACRFFWEESSGPARRLMGPRINYFTKNLYNYAKLGLFLRFAHALARLTRRNPGELLKVKTPEEQSRLFEEMLAPFFDHWLVQGLGRIPFLLFGLGIPPRQVQALKEETGGNWVKEYRSRVHKLACGHGVQDNYFLWQAFGRQYDRQARSAIPEYLKEENYDLIKNGLDNVQTRITSLHEFLGNQKPGSLDRFVFLDSQDWMKGEEITALWQEIARVGKPGTRIIFRTASSRSPVEEALPTDLRKCFVYEMDRSVELLPKDRSSIYGGFHIYSMPH